MAALALDVEIEASALAQALSTDDSFDTATLVCLVGNWPAGAAIIAWDPLESCDHYDGATGPGWIGYQGYEQRSSWWGRFDVLLRQEAAGSWFLETIGVPPAGLTELARRIEQCVRRPVPAAKPSVIADLRLTPESTHLGAVEQAISAIRSGALFQVNVCARASGTLDGDPLELFAAGAGLAADYSGYLRTRARTIVSFSPELFLHRAGSRVRSAPIKGTRPRGSGPSTASEDPSALELARSSKDRAENVMITDLMRNDLSQVCQPGTVRTPVLLQIRPGPGVWHLVSEVVGELRPGLSDIDVLHATFPPGSVTGAPKIRALAAIEEFESDGRGIFTGCIGYLGLAGDSALNVAIRTFEFEPTPSPGLAGQVAGTKFQLGIGGGITADSTPMAEWLECLVKAAPLLALGDQKLPGGGLGSASQVDQRQVDQRQVDQRRIDERQVDERSGIFDTMLVLGPQPVGFADHLTRLTSSAAELYGMAEAELASRWRSELSRQLLGLSGRHRVRTTIRPRRTVRAGQPGFDLDVSLFETSPAASPIRLHSVAGRGGSWRHKWNDRRYLAELESELTELGAANASATATTQVHLPLFTSPVADRQPGAPEALFYETSRSNVAFVPRSGLLVTPPLSEQVLPGISRRRLLDAALDHGWLVEIRDCRVCELRAARLVLSVNSLGLNSVDCLDDEILMLDEELFFDVSSWLAEFGG
jgi:para-aminobenzoate synthetase/4-amino-4-deoxychorismate lyase